MKKINLISEIFIATTLLFSCGGSDDSEGSSNGVTITTADFSESIDENSANGTVLGSLVASASDNSSVTYTLDSQNVSGALALSSAGELTIADATAFDFETNSEITARYTASTGNVSETGNITIDVNDIDLPFKIRVQPNASNQIIIGGFSTLNGVSLTYGFNVDWGDGSAIQAVTNLFNARHTYADDNEYTITVSGNIPHIQLQNGQAVDILQWGEIEWELFNFSFFNNPNLQISATDIPNASNVTDMQGMFDGCTSLNTGNFTDWDVSEVTNMVSLFNNCENFNGDVSSWNVGKVTNMSRMFGNNQKFNQDIGDWDVSSVTNIAQMFSNADAFNQDIGDWNVSKVTSMISVFLNNDAFNQDIGDWDLSSVTGTASMFQAATAFNQDVGRWNVSNITNMSRMFYQASDFNQYLTGWDVDQVTNSFEFGLGSSLTTANTPSF